MAQIDGLLDVATHCNRLAAAGFDFGGGAFQLGERSPRRGDANTRLRQRQRYALADALSGSGDQGCLSVEFVHLVPHSHTIRQP